MTVPSHDGDGTQSTNMSGPEHTSKRFRFKQKHHRSKFDTEDPETANRHTSHHHRAKRRRTTSQPIDNPSAYDDTASRLPPDVAFRESLFDAMGDDEGAAFWEGVYGQPIHTYPNAHRDEETGQLEQMNDEEYAQFVRRKMWEKSWEGIEAAKEEKRKEREREKREIRDDERGRNRREPPQHEPDYLFDLDIERSLRKGERRRDRKRYKNLWVEYQQRWEEMQILREAYKSTDSEDQPFLRNKIAWPVETGKRKDVNAEEIERFVSRCAEALDEGEATLNTVLKTERVRWHPDKIQQRYGFMNIDEITMQGVTAVFQVFDRLWNEQRARGK